MRIKTIKCYHNYCNYYSIEYIVKTQEQYDYIFKHLKFEKLFKGSYLFFGNRKIKIWFYETYITEDYLNEDCLIDIYNSSLDGYNWLKNHWGNGVFKLTILYQDKQELKTIVNRLINTILLAKE